MQGTYAAREVMEALEVLERDAEVDVIVVARGGGSVEDLLPFSDEAVVRAVHAMRTPVVSAIGHEADQPLLDLVADVRASTPTDAARRIVPDLAEEQHRLDVGLGRLRQALGSWLDREQHRLTTLRTRPAMADPRHLLDARSDEVQQLKQRARRTLRHRLDRAGDDVHHAAARVAALSPLATLQRGYAVLQDADGHVVTSIDEVTTGAAVSVRVADGRVGATVDTLTALTPVVPDPEETDD